MNKTEPSPDIVGRLRAWASDMRMFGSADQDLREAADMLERLSHPPEDAVAEALANCIGLQSNGGHGGPSFVKVSFDKPGDQDPLYSLLSQSLPAIRSGGAS